MKFSIIMPSYMGFYQGAATDRHKKIHRAIKSVQMQSYPDWELVIVADGCESTFQEVSSYEDPRISCSLIEKEKIWSGRVRNRGIANAKGEYIIYLDIDDYYGVNHLINIVLQLKNKNYDWVYFNDYIWTGTKFEERSCNITLFGENGTSNICHKRSMEVMWETHDYSHDYRFIKSLMAKSNNYDYVIRAEYYVCHILNGYDV